jgi:hypothetical protein
LEQLTQEVATLRRDLAKAMLNDDLLERSRMGLRAAALEKLCKEALARITTEVCDSDIEVHAPSFEQ